MQRYMVSEEHALQSNAKKNIKLDGGRNICHRMMVCGYTQVMWYIKERH